MGRIQQKYRALAHRHQARSAADDGFVALVVVLLVTVVLSVISGTLFLTTINAQTESAGQIWQSISLNAAEAGLSRGYSSLEEPSVASLPCGSNALSETLGTTPRPANYSVTINYYSTNPPSGPALTCSSVHGQTSTPVSALLTSIGTDAGQQQGMQALAYISVATGGNVFDQALFVNYNESALNGTINGNAGNNANVYIHGNLTCTNGANINGNIVVQGTVSGTNTCDLNANVTAKGNITLQNSTTVTGNATTTTGDMYLNGTSQIDGNAYSSAGITLGGGTPKILGTEVTNDTSLTGPATETFPTVDFNSSAWQAAGYTVDAPDNDCTNDSSSIYHEISAMATATSPTVLQTSCALAWSSSTTVSLNQNLAIFSTGGFTMSNSAEFESASTAPHDLYFIVPSTVTCSGGSPGITLQNSAGFAPSLSMLLFTPCTVTASNSAYGSGQIYGGMFTESNGFTFNFEEPPTPAGATGGGQVAGGGTVQDAIVWEHQYLV
jgi:Tfp pilus assembly protein PilX/cytoskeletal protein CcmA (bactofilin family)